MKISEGCEESRKCNMDKGPSSDNCSQGGGEEEKNTTLLSAPFHITSLSRPFVPIPLVFQRLNDPKIGVKGFNGPPLSVVFLCLPLYVKYAPGLSVEG